MTPSPPACAMAIASGASVTVSMAAEMIGRFSEIEARQPRREVGLAGQHRRIPGRQQHVVEGQRLAARGRLDQDCHANLREQE